MPPPWLGLSGTDQRLLRGRHQQRAQPICLVKNALSTRAPRQLVCVALGNVDALAAAMSPVAPSGGATSTDAIGTYPAAALLPCQKKAGGTPIDSDNQRKIDMLR